MFSFTTMAANMPFSSLKTGFLLFRVLNSTKYVLGKHFHTSSACRVGGHWRQANGLPSNANAYGPLTDNPDFSYIDGRPTPLSRGQIRRIQKNKLLAEKIVQAVREMDFAVERHKRIKQEEEERCQKILDSKLKPKAHKLLPQKCAKS